MGCWHEAPATPRTCFGQKSVIGLVFGGTGKAEYLLPELKVCYDKLSSMFCRKSAVIIEVLL